MASLDAQTDEVVVRIVYDGAPTAGKTTSLRALAQRLGHRVVHTPAETDDGRTLYFDWLEYVGGRYDGRPIRCELVSVPGQRGLRARRDTILATADAVVFVADSSRAQLEETQLRLSELLAQLRQVEPPPGVVLQANKRDLPDAVPVEVLRGDRALAIIPSRAQEGEGVREAFVFAVRLALDRVRELHGRGALQRASAPHDPAQALLTRLEQLAEAVPPEVAPPPASLPDVPPLPDAQVPSGWVWPPINGRVWLHEASEHRATPVEYAPREWLADSGHWRFHSPEPTFAALDDARSALLAWAQAHAALTPWTSGHRCVTLTQTCGGYRLWQVVRHEPSLWSHLTSKLEATDPELRRAVLLEANALINRALERWELAPWELPCTLETIGVDGAFVGVLPATPQLRPAPGRDLRPRLRQQLDSLLGASP